MENFWKTAGEITGAPPEKIFKDLVHFNNVVKFLLKKDDPVAYIVRSRIFPNGQPSPDEFLKIIISKLKTPEDLKRAIRKARIELWQLRLIDTSIVLSRDKKFF
ncbi:MAG: hypothetical protein ACI4PR_05935 [Acutalibacteraceae bacterium]